MHQIGSPSRFKLTSPDAQLKAVRPDSKRHVVMEFTIGDVHAAYHFAGVLRKLDLPAEVLHDRAWFVRTDSRCLAISDKFVHLLEGGAR